MKTILFLLEVCQTVHAAQTYATEFRFFTFDGHVFVDFRFFNRITAIVTREYDHFP